MNKKLLIIISIFGALIIGIIGYLGYYKYQFEKQPDKVKILEGTTIIAHAGFEDKEALDKAEKLYKEALEINPNNAEAYFKIGCVYYVGKKMFKEAENAYKRAIELDPNYTEAYYELGMCYYAQKRTDEATEMFNKTLKIDPKHRRAKESLNKMEYYGRLEKKLKEAKELDAIFAKDFKEWTPEEQKRIEERATYIKEHKEELEKEREAREKARKERMKKSGITEEDLIKEAMKDGMTREEAEDLFLK